MGAEKYHLRPRHLYALVFPGRRVYIGQTVDLKRRAYQHRRSWHEPFEVLPLIEVTGTELQVEDWEFAWRYVAQRAGKIVLARARGGEPFIVRDPRARMTAERYRIARGLRWPTANTATPRRRKRKVAFAIGLAAAAVVLAVILAHTFQIAHLLLVR